MTDSESASRADGQAIDRDRRWWWAVPVLAVWYVVLSRAVDWLASPRTAPDLSVGHLLPAVVAGLIAGLVLGPLAASLPVAPLGRFVVLGAICWVFSSVSNTVEAVLYLSTAGAIRVPLVGLVTAFGLAASLVLLFPPVRVETTVRVASADLFRRRPTAGWVWRWLLLAISWVPIYLVFVFADGALFLTRHLAQTGSTTFAHPTLAAIAIGELIRGFAHVAVLWPLAALLAGGPRRLSVWFPLVIATLNAWIPLIQPVATFDLATRIANLLEITGDAVVFGLLAAVLLSRPRPDRRR